jgi:hypothetical protein
MRGWDVGGEVEEDEKRPTRASKMILYLLSVCCEKTCFMDHVALVSCILYIPHNWSIGLFN